MKTLFRSKRERDESGTVGLVGPVGSLSLSKVNFPTIDGDMKIKDLEQEFKPQKHLSPEVNNWRINNAERINLGLNKILIAEKYEIATFYGCLRLKKNTGYEEIDYGIAGFRVVTTVGAEEIVDAFQAGSGLSLFKFHGFGTGSNAEAVGNTALHTEVTNTTYVGDVRPTGTQTENGSTVYRTVGTYSPDSGGTIAVTEHGIFDANATGNLLDKTLFSVVNIVASQDSLQATYDLTITAGG